MRSWELKGKDPYFHPPPPSYPTPSPLPLSPCTMLHFIFCDFVTMNDTRGYCSKLYFYIPPQQ